MTKIEQVIKEVSDLRDFYLKIQALKEKSKAKTGEAPTSKRKSSV